MNWNDNAQGNYNAGRGADGLGRWASSGSRFGTGVRTADRPGRVGGRRHFAASGMLEEGPLTYARAGVGKGRKPIVVSFPATTTPPSFTARRRRRKPSRAQTIRDRKKFINWLKNFAPGLYVDAKKKADQVAKTEGTLDGLGGWFDSFMDTIGNVGGKYVQFETQKQILEAQMERMRLGLPPLKTSEYAPTVKVQPDAGTTREITGAIGAGISGLLPWIALGGLGLFLVLKK